MLLNYSTKVRAEQTIGQIQALLSGYGVSAMLTEYDGRQVSAVSFKMKIDGKEIAFRMPCNWRAVLEIFKQPKHRSKVRLNGWTLEDQAICVAWRVIKTWVEAQLALVEINMVTISQVFLPYTIMRDGRTLAEHAQNDPSFLLGDGK